MTIDSLLPRGATRTERAIEAAIARTANVPVDLAVLADLDHAPDAFIPFLAWERSTDLWDRDWPIEKKRAAAKAWLRLHRKRGTLAGIEEAVRLFGAEVVAARVPPDAIYPDPSMTREERDRYLARFRQLRFFRFRTRGQATFGAYAGSGFRRPRLFAGGGFYLTFTDARLRVGRRAFVFDPLTGQEQPVNRADRVAITDRRGAVEFDLVSLPGQAGRGLFAGRVLPGRTFAIDTGARRRIYSVVIDREYVETISALHISGALPTAQPIDVRARQTRTPGQRVAGQLFPGRAPGKVAFLGRAGDGAARAFLPRTSAGLRIFDAVFLFDQDRLPDRRSARTFAGQFRLGQAPFHARLTLDVQGRRSPFAFQQFVGGFFLRTSKKPLRQAIEAVRQSKALRDKVLVTAKTTRPVTVADGVRIGTIKVGTWVRDV